MPVASASGMKAAGCSSPRVGCRQRSSASAPADPAVAEVDEGLVGEVHLAVGERVGEVELEPAPLELQRALGGLVQHEAAAPLDLGAAQRGVGLHQQRPASALPAGRHDDADARLHDDGAAVEHQRLADRLQQPAGQRPEPGRPARRDDDEAVALEPHQPVAGFERLLQPRAGDGEQRVAGGDAERLVDGVEAVEIEHHQPGGPSAAPARIAVSTSRCAAARGRIAARSAGRAPCRRRRPPRARASSGAASTAASARRRASAGVSRRGRRSAASRKPPGQRDDGGERGGQPEGRRDRACAPPARAAAREPASRPGRRGAPRSAGVARRPAGRPSALDGIDPHGGRAAGRRQQPEQRGGKSVVRKGRHGHAVLLTARQAQPMVA